MAVPERGEPFRAMLWMIGAVASFSAMAISGREAGLTLDTFEIMTYRSFVGVVVVVLVGAMAGTLSQVRPRALHIHLGRNVFHFAGQNLWFYAMTVMPLAQVISIEFTSPIWVVVFAALFLGEKFTAVKGVTAVMGFIGVLMVAKPDFRVVDPGLVAAALAAVGFALSAVFTKFLTRTATITCILFYLTTMQAVFGLICGFADGHMAWPQGPALAMVGVIGLTGLGAHFCLTRALSLAPASIVMPMDFVRLPVLAFLGWLIYSEGLDLWVIAGSALILSGNLINLRVSAKPR